MYWWIRLIVAIFKNKAVNMLSAYLESSLAVQRHNKSLEFYVRIDYKGIRIKNSLFV